MVGTGAVARECFFPAFEYLNVLPNLTAIDLIIPPELRLAYPGVDFVEGDFERYLDTTHPHKVQAAIVALPNKLHESAVLRLLQAGVHVLCEKPLALTETSCLRMRELAEKVQRRLSVNMIRRFLPSVRTMRQLVQDGEIGRNQGNKDRTWRSLRLACSISVPFLARKWWRICRHGRSLSRSRGSSRWRTATKVILG